MKKHNCTKFHLHAEYQKPKTGTAWTVALFAVAAAVVALLAFGCGGMHYELRPGLNYLKQDNKGIMICRLDAQGGKICEYNLNFYKEEELFVVPKSDWKE